MLPRGLAMKHVAATWSEALKDIEDSELSEATLALVLEDEERWWPTIATVRGKVPRIAQRRAINNVDTADQAWGDLVELVKSKGSYRPPFGPGDLASDPQRAKAMWRGLSAIGGWSTLCRMNESEHMAARASFRAAYRSVMEVAKTHGYDPGRALESEISSNLLAVDMTEAAHE